MRSFRVLMVVPLLGALSGCSSLATLSVAASNAGSVATTASFPRTRVAKPPPGFVAFCERSPGQCETVAAGSPDALPLDEATWEVLRDVNVATNQAIAPETDSIHYGIEEYWTIPADGLGDCDDYVLAKRRALLERGIPGSALRIAIVFTPRFVRHTVLVVATDKGNYVLDNLRDDIVTWDKADYGWIKRQDPSSSSGWAYF